MTPELLALAQRAVGCPRWRWMTRMRTMDGCTFLGDEDGQFVVADPVPEGAMARWVWPEHVREAGWIPDLSDPATLGCLLALVREAWGCPLAHALERTEGILVAEERWLPSVAHVSPGIPGGRSWTCYVYADQDEQREPSHRFIARTEAEALVVALEAAP